MEYPSCHSRYCLAIYPSLKVQGIFRGYNSPLKSLYNFSLSSLDNCFGEYPYTSQSVAVTWQSFLGYSTCYKEVCPSPHGKKIVSRSVPVQVLSCSLRKRAQGATPTRRWICWQTFSQFSWGTWCRLHDTRRRSSVVSWDGGNFSSRYYRNKYVLHLHRSR